MKKVLQSKKDPVLQFIVWQKKKFTFWITWR